MPTPRRVLKGSKGGNTHTSIIEDAVPLLRAVRVMPEVTKYRNGYIVGTGNGKPRLKFWRLPGCLKVVVYGTSGTQELYVYAQNLNSVEQRLQDVWKERA